MPHAPRPSDDALADLLERLVNIPSVSRQEQAIADLIAARLEARGTGEVIRINRSVVWRGPKRKKPLVVLVGHIDTVRPQGNEVARREDGNLIGLGSSDMKAGVAVMLALVETLDPLELPYDLAAVFYDGEEGPPERNGLRRVLRRKRWLRKARLAIVLEPTDLGVEMGCNGSVNLEITVPGRSGHAARPWTGVNAVRVGAEWLAAIQHAAVKTVEVQGLAFRETLEITRLRAGNARNVLPDRMLVNLNHRFPPDRTLEEAVQRVRELVPPEFVFEVRSGSPPGRVCLDDPLVQDFVRAAGGRVAGKQGWTDVARFTELGIPAFNYGPGLVEMCHRADEYCPLANLGVAYDVLAGWLQRG